MTFFAGQLHSKLPDTETSIFAVMSRLAQKHGAVNLSQGFPDFQIDEGLIDRVSHYMKLGYNQYAPYQGVVSLRQAIARKIELTHGVSYDWNDEINITAGATQGLNTVISTFIHKNDEAIIFEPAYDSYGPSIRILGGIVRKYAMRPPDFSINWQEVAGLITEKTRMIIINSPHNPTGSLLREEDLRQLDRITSGTNIIVLSDEVYEHLVFDGEKHVSVCTFPGLQSRSFVVGSFGKTFHATGWKMGFVLAPANLMAEFRKLHQFVVFTCNTPIQHAIADFLSDPEHYQKLPRFYQQKRDYFLEGIKGSSFEVIHSYGTYFQLLNYKNISDLPEMEFARQLVEKHGVAAIPLAPFYEDKRDQQLLRFCFAKEEKTLQKATDILCKI
jgi:methionine aminotransferase